MVRLPGLYHRFAALVQRRLAPRSRLRRALLRRHILSGWCAYNRRDFELMLVRYASQVEFDFPPGQQTLGLSGTFRGREAMVAGLREQIEGWGSAELELAYVLDLGDRALALGFLHVRGRASGVRLRQELGQLVTAGPEGLTVRDQAWFSWEEALRAAELDPGALVLPRRRDSRPAAPSAK